MGELVAAQPAIQLNVLVSLPIDFISTLSLLYRALPGAGFDPWLVNARRALPDETRYDLDILEGFSGRLLYYLEAPINRFDPLASTNRDATFPELLDFVTSIPAEEYRELAIGAVRRVRRDSGLDDAPPVIEGDTSQREHAWARFLEPALTTATVDEVIPLFEHPDQLRTRTINLFRIVWQTVYRDEFLRQIDMLHNAAEQASTMLDRGFGVAFSDLTGARVPAPLAAALRNVSDVVFHPSAHIGSYVSYLIDPPRGVIFFNAPGLLRRIQQPGAVSRGSTAGGLDAGTGRRTDGPNLAAEAMNGPVRLAVPSSPMQLDGDQIVASARALGDTTRLRILELLSEREQYAQELVSALGIAQSAVSRHLALLERSGLVRVRPYRGMKYYSIDTVGLRAFASSVATRLILSTDADLD